MTEARDIERLFEIWEQNVATVRRLNASREKLEPIQFNRSHIQARYDLDVADRTVRRKIEQEVAPRNAA